MSDPNPEIDAADDGGLSQVQGALEAQKRAKEAEKLEREQAEANQRNIRIGLVEDAFVHQDATILKAVSAFLQKAAHITPTERIVTQYVKRRRFVPFAIESYSEPAQWDRAHLIFQWQQSNGEDSYVYQTLMVRSNGVVLFTHSSSSYEASPWMRAKHGDGSRKADRPTDKPGVLPFWVPKPDPGQPPLRAIPYFHDDLGVLSEEDVKRTTEWVVRTLAAYLLEGRTVDGRSSPVS
jgi:hypothetical protein